MGKRKKTGGRNFLPGQCPNPNGRPKMPPELKEAKKLTQTQIEIALTQFLAMDDKQLRAIIKDPKSTRLQAIIASIVDKAIKIGDQQRLDFLLNRIIGKVKEPPTEVHNFNFNMMPRPQVIEIGKKAVQYLEAQENERDEA